MTTGPLQIGRYEPIRPIASGGMATVYLARAKGARGFERHVALKVMHPHLAEDPEFVSMFLDEARMAANIRHPNVVPTLDVVEDDGRLFLVMEYIEGCALQSLLRWQKRQKKLIPLDVTLRITLDCLAGLHAAHELVMSDGAAMNIVHRDMSPHNVLVGVDGIARILDFGVARAEFRIHSTMGANPKGKIPYMSPEQLLSKGVDRRTDIYAAGIVLWELLVGTGLFRADNEGALVTMVAAGTTRAPIDANPNVPQAISDVCMKALAVRVDDRYATAAAFADALERAAEEARAAIATPRGVGALIKEVPADKARSAGGGSPDSMRPSSGASDASGPGSESASRPGSGSESASRPGSVSVSSPGSASVSSAGSASVPRIESASVPAIESVSASAPAIESASGSGGDKASSALVVASGLSDVTTPPVPQKRNRGVVIAVIAASVVAGVLAWLFTRGGSQPGADAQGTAPELGVSAAPTSDSARSVASSAPSASAIAVPAQPSASASAEPSGAQAGAASSQGVTSATPGSQPVIRGVARPGGTKKPGNGAFRPEEP